MSNIIEMYGNEYDAKKLKIDGIPFMGNTSQSVTEKCVKFLKQDNYIYPPHQIQYSKIGEVIEPFEVHLSTSTSGPFVVIFEKGEIITYGVN